MKLCVFSIAAGAGLTLALASVAEAIFFGPLPVESPERVLRIPGRISYKDFQDFKQAKSVEGLIAQTQVLLAIGEGDAPRRVELGLAVTGDYFDAMGIHASHGRVFHASEWREPVVVLASGASPALVGREMRMGSANFRVIGIAPQGFGLDRFVHEKFYIPMGVYEAGILPGSEHVLEDRGRRFLTVAGRLARGAKVGQARAEIEGMAARLEREYPETNRGRKATVETEMESRMGGNPPVGPFAWLLAAMGAVILAIAAANAGGLLLGRAERKSQEIAVKLALGATWMRLAAGFAREAMGVVAAGAALGFPMAWAAAKMLARRVTLPTDFSFSIDPKFDARIGAVAALGLGVIAITCACAPAMAARRIEIGIAIQRRSRWRGALAAVEIGLAGALAMMGVALVDGIRAAQNIDPGYRVEQVVTVAMDPVQEGYTKAQARAFFETVLERVRGVAGVKRAALAQSAVLGYMRAPARVQCERDAAVHSADDSMWMNTVSPEYFELMRLPLMAGRGFDERDTEASEAAAIVNQELAKRCGMGQRIRVNGRAARVVGIARNAKYFDLQEKTQPYVYLAFAQNFASRMVLHAEVEGDAARMIPALERVIHAIDPGMAVSEARPLGESIERGSMFSARAAVDAVSGIGGCAIALALVGVYGAIAQFTARRKREMGIRAALGASTAGLIRWAMRGAGELVAIGVAGGMAAGVAGERLLAARVPGIPGWDWAGLWAVAGILAIAAVAGLIPAGRAARSNPTVLLRTE